MVARPALTIYSFAPKDLPNHPDLCREAHEYLSMLWRGCEALGMNQAVPNLNVSTDFPARITLNDSLFRIVAAKVDLERRARKADYHAFLFEYQDILGLVANLETNLDGDHISVWKSLFSQWNVNGGKSILPSGMMEETYLFTALHENNEFATNLRDKVVAAMPGNNGNPWRAMNSYVTNANYCLWGGEQVNGRRTAALLAPRDKQDDLFRWIVWPGSRELAPFARYLMHAAKLHFAHRLFEAEAPRLHAESQRLDETLSALLSLYQESQEKDLWNPHEITRAHAALTAEQTKNFGLFYGMSKLKELSLTTRIATRNMQQLVPPADSGVAPDNNLFQQDRARSVLLREQIDMDLGYLRALRERVSEGHRLTRILLERESEKTSKRLKNLVLLQGTVIGSLTIGLLMLPAFEHFHDEVLVWGLTAFFMAIVLALPTLFERWHEHYTLLDRLAGSVLGATSFFAVTSLWEYIGEGRLWWPVAHGSQFSYVVFKVIVCIIGLLFGYLGVGRLEKLKSTKLFRSP